MDIVKFVSTIRPPRGNVDSYYLLANHYQKKGLHKDAVQEFKKIIAIDPLDVKAYNGIGVSYDKMGYYEEAVKSYQKAISINPDLDYVLNNLGYTYLNMGKSEDAVRTLERAVALNSQNKRIHSNLALAYARNREYEKAFEEFKSVGNETTAYSNLGQIHDENRPGEDEGDKAGVLVTSTSERDKNQDSISSDSKEDNLKVFISQLSSPGKNISDSEVISGNSNVVQKSMNSTSGKFPAHSLKKAGIEISNGNGVSRMATRIGKYLNAKGFHVTRLTNASNFDYPKTVIYYQKEYSHAAQEVSQQMPGEQIMEDMVKQERAYVKVKVLIGKDIAKYDSIFSGS